jgi:hypothetical protein
VSLAAGVGVADITPTEPVRLAGFFARQPAVPPLVVNDPLQVRALALRDGDTTVLLLVLDLVGLSADRSAALRLAVSAATGVPAHRVLPSCTHTHSGPDTLLGMDLYDGYAGLLAAGAVAAARDAVASLAPASIGAASVPLPAGLAVNRRGLPFAPRLTALDIRSERRLATLANVGIHPVTHGPDVHVVTADWVGHCRAAMEAVHGGTAFVVSGPLGDVNPPGGAGYDRDGGGPGLAAAVGERLAEVVATAVGAAKPVDGDLAATHRTVTLPVADGLVPGLIAGGAREVVAELYEWSYGALRVVSMPGEPLSAFGTAVEAARPGTVVVQAGLAPSWQGYLPHPDTFDDTAYEERTGLGRPAVRALLDALTGAT